MRNLRLLDSLRIADAAELQGTQQMCIDYDTKVVYCATSTGLYGLDPNTQQICCEVSLVDGGYLSPDGSGELVGMEYLPDDMSVCVATSSGDVLLWQPTNSQLECVGSVEHGLTAMSWSADLELVVLATGQRTIIMMTREFDPVTEVAMFTEEFGEAEFVNVGWGKKETQFHGSEGKQAALIKKADTVTPACAWDDLKTRICWHGDGQYFVVSAVQPITGNRRLRVWTRECTLHATGELVDGLEQAISWKSTGNLITSSQQRPNKHDIVFFEKNGLRHGEFTLPFAVNQVKVCELHWNKESNILAVWLEDLPKGGGTAETCQSHVELWTVSNYHWYQKQSLRFAATDRVVALCWDQEYAARLHVMCQGGEYVQYTWSWVTDTTRGILNQNMANVAVIDGDRVLMTPFRQMVVPPPMSAYQLQLQSPVNQIILAPPPIQNDIAVLTSDNKIAIFTFQKDVESVDVSSTRMCAAGGNGFSVQCELPVLRAHYSIEGDTSDGVYPLQYYHVTWYKPDTMLLCTVNMMGSESLIHSVILDHDSAKLRLQPACEVGGFVYAVAVSAESGSVLIELTDGRVLRYHTENNSLSPWLMASGEELVYTAPRLCSQLDICTIGGQEVVLGLTDHFQFYVDNIQIATNCTSYVVHEEFLLLTTYAHTCRCIARKTKVQALPTLSDGKAHPFDETIRRVERGSRIVTVVTGETKLVLQMPRGNLETIHPRALVLCAVRKLLDKLEFQKAFTLMRRHRINMNLMHDHNPQMFLDNINKFIEQVDSPALINQFLTDLQEENVTRTMYTAAYNQQTATSNTAETDKISKIDRICDCIRGALESTDPDKYLLSILTAYVRKSTPELDVALKKVKDLNVGGNKYISAEEALKYLLFLVDVNELYDVALGTYDFQLVLLVAEKSQKDPREYIPFLNSLRKMEQHYQHYTIDKHLKRYTSALRNIAKCGADQFPECMNLIIEQRLYREALDIYKPGTPQYKDIGTAYGRFLSDKKHHQEAGLVLSKAEAWTEAVEAYEKCLSWQMALCAAYRAGYDRKQQAELSRRLVAGLKETNRHSEAALILDQHLDDLEEAIVMLIEGAQWDEALRMMYKSGRTDFIETHLEAAILQSHSEYVTLLDNIHTQFEKHRSRLIVVREQKEKARLEFLEGGYDHNAADADLFSDTSSATGESSVTGSQLSSTSSRSTIFSQRSGRSAKTRRKMERKKWSLKEGSAYEDIALVEALSKTYKQTEEWRGDVGPLLRMLSLFHHEQEATDLQLSFEKLLALVEKSVTDIWPEEAEDTETTLASMGPDSTANAIAQAMQRGAKIRPEIKIEPSLRMAPVMTKDNKWKLHSSLSSDR